MLNGNGSNKLAWLIAGFSCSLLLNATLGGALLRSNAERERQSADIRANSEAIKANTQAISLLSARQGRTEANVENCEDNIRRLEGGG